MRGSSVRSRRCCRTCLRSPSYAREPCGGCARACRRRRRRRACRVRCTSGDGGLRGGACGSLMAIGAIPGEEDGSKMHGCHGWLVATCLLASSSGSPFMCAVRTVLFVATLLWRSLSVFLPLQLSACVCGSFDE